MEALTEAAILQHGSLRGLGQSIAEEYYILAAQQLEGYGQQTFAAKVSSLLTLAKEPPCNYVKVYCIWKGRKGQLVY